MRNSWQTMKSKSSISRAIDDEHYVLSKKASGRKMVSQLPDQPCDISSPIAPLRVLMDCPALTVDPCAEVKPGNNVLILAAAPFLVPPPLL